MAQLIRRSQFITTYGPGAILEGPEGPRVVKSLDQSGLFATQPPDRFEITDRRLSETLLNGGRILRIPSNAELGRPDSDSVYETSSFPTWSLCTGHNILYHKLANDNRTCPRCALSVNSYEAWEKAHREAIRFVRACEAGHLDDVDWGSLIDHAIPNCRPTSLTWGGAGGALRNIIIRCPNCNAEVNLGAAYSRDWPCSGRLPEYGPTRPGCAQRSKIIQRGAANLRLAELQTSLTIPPRATRLHRLIEQRVVMAALVTAPRSKRGFLETLQRLVDLSLLSRSVVSELDTYEEADILNAWDDSVQAQQPSSPRVLRLQEMQALRNAAANGAPPQPSSTPGSPHQFEVIRSEVRQIPLSTGRSLRITPVNRLRVVMVQTGYRRITAAGGLVDVSLTDTSADRWYPGVELFGEGIFIDLHPEGDANDDPVHFELVGQSARAWFDHWRSQNDLPSAERDRLHPVFVWWHTFAHRVVTALSIDSGYSSAAIRERVYVSVDDQSGRAGGGVLLYTAQPGGDGTLGGLVALAPFFERVLTVAMRNLDACSNDPLCGEEQFTPQKYNGAACYSCALVSETSCEFRNIGLDRNVLLRNLP